MPAPFKNVWVDYIENEFDKLEYGHWFMRNGKPNTSSSLLYALQWTKIDVGYPDFREALEFLHFWEV